MGQWDGSPQASQWSGTKGGLNALFERIERIEKLLHQLSGADILSAADVLVHKGGLTIASELLVTGDTRIEGTLSLPAGIIDNDALANPVAPSAFGQAASNFGAPALFADLITINIPVPAGFTRAVVVGIATLTMTNQHASATTFAEARVVVAGSYGPSARSENLGPGVQGGATAGSATQVTGLVTGAMLAVKLQGALGLTQAATPGNFGYLSGVVLWLR